MRVASSASLAATDYGGVPWHWQPPQPLACILLSIPSPIPTASLSASLSPKFMSFHICWSHTTAISSKTN